MPFRLKNRIYYGWVIVILFLVIQVVLMGVNSTFSVFFKHIETAFGLTRTTTSAISSVSMIIFPLTAFAGGWIMDRYGPRRVVFFLGLFAGLSLVLTSQTNAAWQLFLTYSLLLAMGIGAIYTVSVSTVSKWFLKKRGLAVGISGSGEGLGTVIMVPLSTFLISGFDWKIAYLILGLVIWVLVIPLSRLIKKDPQEIGLLPDGMKPDSAVKSSKETENDAAPLPGVTLSEILKSRGFWLVSGIWLFFGFCMMMLFTHIVPHMTDTGISDGEAAAIVGLIGAARAVGMIGLGVVADKIGRKKVAVVSTLVQAGAMLWLVWIREPWMFYLFGVIYGLGNGGLYSGVTSLLGDTFGLGRLGSVLGLLEIGWGIGAAIGPLVGGFFFDNYSSYSWAFVLAAIAMLLVTFLILILKPERNLSDMSIDVNRTPG
jgi:MFS transporter, OFA family, oxalate/formate antiporter